MFTITELSFCQTSWLLRVPQEDFTLILQPQNRLYAFNVKAVNTSLMKTLTNELPQYRVVALLS